MLFIDCKCFDNDLGSATRPDRLKLTIDASSVLEQLITELSCFSGGNQDLLYLQTNFDIVFQISYLDDNQMMVNETHEETSSIREMKGGVGSSTVSNTEFIYPYNSPSGMTVTGTLTFSECHCCCNGPNESLQCSDDNCPNIDNMCTNSGKPTFSLIGMNTPITDDDGNLRYFDSIELRPTLGACSECGCTATYSFDEC